MQIEEKVSQNEKPLDFYRMCWPDFDEDDLRYEQDYDKDLDEYLSNKEPSHGTHILGALTDLSYKYFVKDNNSYTKNRAALITLKKDVQTNRLQPAFNSYRVCFDRMIPLLESYISKFLITEQLAFLFSFLDEAKLRLHIARMPEEINFEGFVFTERQCFDEIRKKTKWHQVERDISIFQEKPFYTLRQLAKRYGIKYNSISSVVSKVQGAINEIIGKKFEEFILEKLRASKLFEKVERKGGVGEPDILAYKNKEKLYVYSLKCLKLESSPYWLIKGELLPELEYAKLCSQDYEIHLILLVFDSFNQKIINIEIDYNNPSNIELTKFLK